MAHHVLNRIATACAALLLAGAVHAQTLPAPAIEPAVEDSMARLLAAPVVRRAMDGLKADHDRAMADLKLLTEIPAPPFKEQARAQAFLQMARAIGLDARIDAEGNVVGVRKGTGNGPKLLVSAHLDTVFPEGTDVTVKVQNGRWLAPGISDDTRGLAVLLSWLRVLKELDVQTVGDLMFVANVGEEELGDLRGIKAIFREHPDIDGMVGLEPPLANTITTGGVGSHRHEVTFKGPGGHSYLAFGLVPSAIHGLGRAIAKISEVRTPAHPKTTFTVGTIAGGTSVNTIAPEARMGIDIRSVEMASLLETERKILAALDEALAEENRRWNTGSLGVSRRLIGDRPAGATPSDARIVQAAVRAQTAFGKPVPRLATNSSDANVPMSLGIPAVVISNGGEAGNQHTRAEWFDPRNAWEGAQIGLATILGLVGVQGVTEPLLARRAPR